MSGVIKLLHNGEVNKYSPYSCPKNRDAILAGWKKLVGKLYNKMEIVDEPHEDMRGRYERIKESPRFKKGDIPKTYASPTKKITAIHKSYKNLH